jgi:nanoRNase/pAp phosphatase (c-di-AMP/oligoRNAs hydrolase)
MNTNNEYARINQILENNQSFGICLPEKLTLDTIAAATSLYIAFSKLGKDVSIACSGTLPQDNSIVGMDKIQNKLGIAGDTLTISFPYTEGSIDKVSYHIEGENFNLLIQPRPGFSKLNPDQVKYVYSGGKVDVLITIDAPTLASLGQLYAEGTEQFKGKEIINIDRHLTNGNFGSLNIIERQTSSTSEIIFNILKTLQIEIDRDIATNLYAGISVATNNFTSFAVNANTFETCAFLLKNGAVKKNPLRAKSPFPVANRFAPRPQTQPRQNFPSDVQNDVQPPKQVENKEARLDEEEEDWLKPKIFTSSDVNSH